MRAAVLTLLILAVTTLAQPPDVPATGRDDPRCAPLDKLMTSFVRDHKVPGAALAVARGGRLLYARGFGYADTEAKIPVQPDSLFRIASVSKPLTSAAVMKLVEDSKLRLEDHPFELLGLKTDDPRAARITIRDLLTHSGGWDRDKSGDPMFMSRRIATELHIPSPPGPKDIARWMAGRTLDFDPGTKATYSNFGYCLLGCVIEKASGMPYEQYVQTAILKPAGATRMRIGATRLAGRAEGEVRYYSTEVEGPSVFEDQTVPSPYGKWCLESMQAHGGWISSAPDLVRFGSAIGEPGRILTASRIEQLWARPTFIDLKAETYYALGWSVRPAMRAQNVWHGGSLPGTGTLLVRRHDGFVWAVLFNTREGNPAGAIDGLIHAAVDEIKVWPEGEPLIAAPAAPPASTGR